MQEVLVQFQSGGATFDLGSTCTGFGDVFGFDLFRMVELVKERQADFTQRVGVFANKFVTRVEFAVLTMLFVLLALGVVVMLFVFVMIFIPMVVMVFMTLFVLPAIIAVMVETFGVKLAEK